MGAFLIASVSMFVSCKDYDDDISKNSQEITALKSQLESLKSSLSSELSAAKSELNNALANKANASDLDKKANSSDLTALEARVAALETQIKAIDECATKSDLDAVKATLAALTGELDKAATPDDIAKAVEAQNKIQSEALEAYKKEVESKGYLTEDALTQLKKDVADLQDKLSKIDVNAAVEDLQKKSQALLEELQKKVDEQIATMKLFVVGKLTSVVLKPDFYWEGIEGVEVPQLHTPIFKPVGKYTFSYHVDVDGLTYTKGDPVVKVTVDEVMAAPLASKINKTEYLVLETSTNGGEVLGGDKEYGNTNDNKYYLWKYWDIYGSWSGGYHNYSIKVAQMENAAYNIVKDNAHGALTYVDIMENPIINYHINPSTADIEGAKIEFYENDAEVYTRNGSDAISPKAVVDTYTKAGENADDPHHTNIYNKTTGILSIPFQCNWNVVNALFSKWAYDNDTYADREDYSTYEPDWDWGHHERINTWTDEEGNTHQYLPDATAYGTSDYYKADGTWLGRGAAPLPFIAVELTTKDTLVTSDYAVVVPAKIQIVALADKAPEKEIYGIRGTGTYTSIPTRFVNNHTGGDHYADGIIGNNHLYESVGYSDGLEASDYSYGAIPMPATHTVAYNGKIDLKPFIETHYSYTTYTKYGQSNKDQLMTDDMLKALGLHYEFKAINYIKGNNETGESVHVEEIEEGVFAPRSVTEDGQTITGQTATREAIGREPLIRVDLVDANGNIVRYGYIKLRITDVNENYEPVTITFGDKYMNCGDSVIVTWSQMEKLILSKLNEGKGMTKQEFENTFKFDDEWGHSSMPTNANGALYKTAAGNHFWAKRYYQKADGTFELSMGKKTENAAYGFRGFFTKETAEKWNKDNGTTFKEGDEVPADPNAAGSMFTADNNWWGRVWYTPHDNPTTAQNWDEQTNVLVWNITPAYAGNMTKARYQALMKKVGVDETNPDYKFDGASTVDFKTTVCFINKASGKRLFVTLVIPATKLHFNYGEVGNKDWSHWFKFNGGLWNGGYHNGIEGTSTNDVPFWEEFDTHVNPHKPSNVNYVYLNTNDLTQRLTDFWLDPANMVIMKGGDNFSMFKADAGKGKSVEGDEATIIRNAAPDITFIFTYPKDKLNSDGVSAGVKNLGKNEWTDAAGHKHTIAEKKNVTCWDVTGASGTVWSLTIGAHDGKANTAIFAIGKNGKAYGPEEVAYLDNKDAKGNVVKPANSKADQIVVHYHGLEAEANLYPAATDLINKSGAYDARGNERFTRGGGLAGISQADYLEKNVDETFTAYIKMDVKHGCYDPIIAKQYFNVRIYRPINVAGLEVEWYDRVLADNTLDIKDLVEVVDWNDFAVVPFGAAAVKERNTVFGIERPKYADVYQDKTRMKATNAGIPFEYYGISELAVRYDEIRTDHAKEVSVRNNVYYDEESILKNTTKVCDLPSLKSDRESPAGYRTLTLLNADTNNPDGTLIVPFGKAHAYAHSDLNKSGNGTKFGRIYYNNDAGTVQLFHIYVPIAVKYNWGNIAWDDRLGDQPGVKLNNDYTQKVWAVITVNATHKK